MNIEVRACTAEDIPAACAIWNRVVEDGVAFPQMEPLDEESGTAFFAQQSFTGVAVEAETGQVVGLYILHPNNVGRCGHICNASYAVQADLRGQHIGEALVRHSLGKGRDLRFRVLQFNAVVCSNVHALRLYEKLGFVRLGMVPGGFLRKDGVYDDITLMYHTL
ncbi:MAG: GNAT family N-acetyltransferase [Clostridiales bacterium]|nr:GNAT family N-acetyltransferase [Clostridiales bacterium]